MKPFPKDFDFGIASSAYQMEGGYLADGKGLSIWDVFAQKPGAIAGGGTGEVGCDHYHHWQEDVAILREMGVNTYRLSVSWARVFPAGDGPVNEKGLQFYCDLADALQKAGISPMVNLHHYDLPQALMDKGGWMSRHTVDAYVRYAQTVFDALAKKASRFMVFNDVRGTLLGGYVTGERAPGRRGELKNAIQGWHNMQVAGAMAMADFRRRKIPGGEIGCVMGIIPARPADGTREAEKMAAELQFYFNDAFLWPLLRGEYPKKLTDTLAAMEMMPLMHPGDLAVIAENSVDFIGVSYYTPMNVAKNPGGDPRNPMSMFRRCPKGPVTAMGWEIDPTGLYDVLTHIRDAYGNPRCYVGEIGAAFDDGVMDGETVIDDDRIAFLRAHIAQARRAMEDGCNVAGIHLWTLLDNFEWQHGFTKKFGLVRVDRHSGRRHLKKSARWYRAFLRQQREGTQCTHG